MYKLCLYQSYYTQSWEWSLQSIEPHDWPFDFDRAQFHGIQKEIRAAIKEAHTLVPRDKVAYVYMERGKPS